MALCFPSLQSKHWFFFFPNLGGRWVGIHPQEDLARFGYTSDRPVEKFSVLCYSVATCYNLLSKYGDFKKVFLIMLRHGAIFSQKKPLYLSQAPFYLSQAPLYLCEISRRKFTESNRSGGTRPNQELGVSLFFPKFGLFCSSLFFCLSAKFKLMFKLYV
jgi:hypothetical protein